MKPINNNIFLIGLMGAGKTTTARRLADIFSLDFYDSDHVIVEKTGVSIPTIFEQEGEEGFRRREIAVIQELSLKNNIILATGGGVVLRAENRKNLSARGTVIYLHACPDILLERTKLDPNRPLLQVDNPLLKLQELYTIRDPLYRQTADYIVDAGNGHCHQTIEQILNLFQFNK